MHTHTHTHSHIHTPSLTHSHTHTHSHIHTPPLSLTCIHTHACAHLVLQRVVVERKGQLLPAEELSAAGALVADLALKLNIIRGIGQLGAVVEFQHKFAICVIKVGLIQGGACRPGVDKRWWWW